MSNELSNAERMGDIVDKIFLLNHTVVSQMLMPNKDGEITIDPVFRETIENVNFNKLAEAFAELREVIREAIQMGDEMSRPSIEGYYEDETITNEILIQSRESVKSSIINTIQTRIEGLYISMNFIPITITKSNQTVDTVPSIYEGKPEEAIRMQEYRMLIESVAHQLDIIEYEDFFKNHTKGKDFMIAPLISTTLIDAISDRAKYALAEGQCAKFVHDSKQQEEMFDEYPELRETMEKVEYLWIEERFKRKFEAAVGLMNEKTSYSQRFFQWYEQGLLPTYTHFSKEEIDSRMQSHIKAYSDYNKQNIQNAFDTTVQKYQAVRAKRNIKNFSDFIKARIASFPQKYIRKMMGSKPVQEMKKESTDTKQKQQNLQGSKTPRTVKEPKESDGR